jgi:hypothetical protein
VSGIPRILVPHDVALALRRDKGPIRVVATLNGYAFHAAVMPQQDGGFVMMTGKVRAGGRVEVGEVVTLELTPDDSAHGLPVPAELEEALGIDRAGARIFASLTPGRQRGLIALVDRQKGPDARANKALAVLDGLKCGVTDLKELARHKVAGRTLD